MWKTLCFFVVTATWVNAQNWRSIPPPNRGCPKYLCDRSFPSRPACFSDYDCEYGSCCPESCRARNICVERGSGQNVCHLPRDPGHCYGYFPRYYFDKNAYRCRQFIYGGCGGNENRFLTRYECKNQCRGMGYKAVPG